jgi:apolipoprotein N-acyltransferase
MRTKQIVLATGAAVLSAALLYFGTGLHPVWPLLWLAPAPLLAIAPRLRGKTAFLLACVAWVIGELNLWNYVIRGLALPLPLVVVMLVIPAIAFALGVLFTRSFLRRGSVWLAAFAFSIFWVAYEYLTEVSSPHSTFGNLAYTQMNCLPIIQIASVTGVWGISFIVFLVAGSVAVLLSGFGKRRERRALALIVATIVFLVFAFGGWRLRSTSSESMMVTLLAKDVPMSVYLGAEQQGLQLLRDYADEIRGATPAGTQIVVLPEKIARVSERALAEVDTLFRSVAHQTNAAIDVGLVRQLTSGSFNSSRLYSPNETMANYDKHHLLPGVEPEKSGDQRTTFDYGSKRLGLQICKDMDFPQLSREYANDGAALLLVPAWDFNLDRWLHARMAVLRAVENGFALARSARNGLLTLSDNRGRIVAEGASAPDRFVSITAKVNVVLERTVYTRTGDWFAWLCVLALIFLLILPFFRRKASSS